MPMYANCPKCGNEVEINKMPDVPGKASQGGPLERLPNTPVTCPNCKDSFLPMNPVVRQG